MRHSLFIVFLTAALPCFSFDHSHNAFDQILGDVVIQKGWQTTVDYDLLHSNPDSLNNYLDQLEAVKKTDFDSWNKQEQMAFLINSYNAFTLKLILNNYPEIESIRDLGGLFSSPWKKKFFNLFGKKTNLDYIEHNMLRKEYNEPRIHFAINCASKSCPALQKKAYIGSQLNEQLENATVQFLRDPQHNRFNKEKNQLEISSLFDWFKTDFTKSGSLINFISAYISDDPEIQNLLKHDSIKIKYLDYNWSLNKL